MKRLTILLDSVAKIRKATGDSGYDPVRIGVLAENAGADGLACSYTGDEKGITERDIRLLKEIRTTYFNLYIPPTPEAVRTALSVTPDMVTFADFHSADGRGPLPITPALHLETIQTLVPDLKANQISVAAVIPPEISVLKSLNKLQLDYVDLCGENLTNAADVNEELVESDKIRSAAMAAAKLGFGVNCSGDLGYAQLSVLTRVPYLEDLVLGCDFARRALYVGVEQAVKEGLHAIRES